jgi:hypothetical protein
LAPGIVLGGRWAGQEGAVLAFDAVLDATVGVEQPAEGLETGAANEDSDSKEGSYTNTHESGKKYHGKGSEERAKQSGKEKAEENNDPVKETEWTSSANKREAFKDEAKRIRNDGGVQNSNNYNKINSPGEKYLNQDGR